MPIQNKGRHSVPGGLVCPICHEPVDLKTAKCDEDGNAVHEECYAKKMAPHVERSQN